MTDRWLKRRNRSQLRTGTAAQSLVDGYAVSRIRARQTPLRTAILAGRSTGVQSSFPFTCLLDKP